MLKNYLCALLMLATSLVSLPGWAQLTPAEAMNMAGLQRSLGQRLAKNYLMIGSDVRTDVATAQMQETLTQFDKSHAALTEFAPTPELRAALVKVGETWLVYRPQITAVPTKEQAVAMLATSEIMLEQCQAVTDLMAKQAGATGDIVNRSGWERVMSQRIAMLYLAEAWAVPAPDLAPRLNKSVADFERILKELEASGTPNDEIAASLRKARAQWAFTLKGIDLQASKNFVPTVIVTSTDSLFRQMNELTRLYAGLPAK